MSELLALEVSGWSISALGSSALVRRHDTYEALGLSVWGSSVWWVHDNAEMLANSSVGLRPYTRVAVLQRVSSFRG